MGNDVVASTRHGGVPGFRSWVALEDDGEEIDDHGDSEYTDGCPTSPLDEFADKDAQIQGQYSKFRKRTANDVDSWNDV